MRLALAVLLTACLSGCATVPQKSDAVSFTKPGTGEATGIRREQLVGTWYGRQPTNEGTTKEWITRREMDGNFHVRFRERQGAEVLSESEEVGEWGLSYDLEIVITRGWIKSGQFHPAPPDAYFWDVYRLEHVDAAVITYVHQGVGHRYQVHRVADDFKFPSA